MGARDTECIAADHVFFLLSLFLVNPNVRPDVPLIIQSAHHM